MQTFLPDPNFAESAMILDRMRLGKQRVECLQILKALTDPTYGWQNHPAVKMWRGSEIVLVEYGLLVCIEWIHRGYKDTCRNKICELRPKRNSDIAPEWLGNKQFHDSHKAALLFKWKNSTDREQQEKFIT